MYIMCIYESKCKCKRVKGDSDVKKRMESYYTLFVNHSNRKGSLSFYFSVLVA